MSELHNLSHFTEDQNHCYPEVLEELRAGIKQTHGVWLYSRSTITAKLILARSPFLPASELA